MSCMNYGKLKVWVRIKNMFRKLSLFLVSSSHMKTTTKTASDTELSSDIDVLHARKVKLRCHFNNIFKCFSQNFFNGIIDICSCFGLIKLISLFAVECSYDSSAYQSHFLLN